jgi:hypothetical protein
MTILDEIKKRAGGKADNAANIAEALAMENDLQQYSAEPIATVLEKVNEAAAEAEGN